ncbi:MAG TPA: choice-of-anchor N protein [Polyangiales bacterium]|nr:choice-of-anchor N protein [Polyangiales bacterium]
MKKLSSMATVTCVLAAIALFAPARAWAYPALQLYVEGGTYDSQTQTWVGSSTTGSSARLWVIGDTGAAGVTSLSDIHLSAVYDVGQTAPTVSFTGSTTGGFGGFTDSSTAGSVGYVQTVTGGTPTLQDGSSLPSHGEYGANRQWQEFSLGDFTLKDSPIADFSGAFPSVGLSNSAQINVYSVTFSQAGNYHFDAWGWENSSVGKKIVQTSSQVVFAPFSHDAEVNVTSVPELDGSAAGTSFALLCAGALVVTGRRRKTV